ncbi:unnamed protein product [Agarophyton chilense]
MSVFSPPTAPRALRLALLLVCAVLSCVIALLSQLGPLPDFFRLQTVSSSPLASFPKRFILGVTPHKHLYPPGRFAIPPEWRDTDHKYVHVREPVHRSQRRNRAFVSSIPESLSDGFGHRFLMLRADLYIATQLNVGYVHRTSRYGTLSPDHDPKAIERMMGWLWWNDTRDQVLQSECEDVRIEPSAEICNHSAPNQPVCRKLRRDGTFNRLVHIPTRLLDCFVEETAKDCAEELKRFADLHNESDTLFSMQPSQKYCAAEYRFGSFLPTSRWFRNHYWSFHKHTTLLDGEYVNDGMNMRKFQRTYNSHISRVLPYDESRIQIAVHVRRGDIFLFPRRKIIPDAVYADVVSLVKQALDEEFGADVSVTVSVFSEGFFEKGCRSLHDIERMKPIYLTEEGKKIYKVGEHWKELLEQRLNRSLDLRVQTFIATDTVTAIHSMVTADVFVGSHSGLTFQTVSVLSRGVVLLPEKIFGNENPHKSQDLHHWYQYGNGISTQVDLDRLKKNLGTLLRVQSDYAG